MNSILLNTNISVCRNISNYKFPLTMSESDRKFLNKSLILFTYSIFDKEKIKIENLKNMDSINRNLYMERDIIPNELYKQESFVLNINNNIFIETNIRDHFRLSFKEYTIDLKKDYLYLKSILKQYEKQFRFAYDYEFGYKTADFKNIGSGLTAYAILHLPSLPEHELQDIFQFAKVNNLMIYPYYSNYPYFYYVLQTAKSTTPEEEIFEKMKHVIHYIAKKELTERKHLLNNKDKINKINESIRSMKTFNKISEENSIEKISDYFLLETLKNPENIDNIEHFKLLNQIKKFSILYYKKTHESNKGEREVRAEIIKNFIERERNYAKQF